MLPVILTEQEVDQLFKECEANEGYQLTVDLDAQEVRTPSGQAFKFEVDSFRKHCLLNGLDDIGLTLQAEDDIHVLRIRSNKLDRGFLRNCNFFKRINMLYKADLKQRSYLRHNLLRYYNYDHFIHAAK